MSDVTKEIELCYRQIGLRIEGIRKVLGITQDDLAKKIGWSRGSIANIETGRERLLLHKVERLAEALGTTPKGLLKGIWT